MKAYANDSVMDWYSEINLYNFTSSEYSSFTGHFTQV